MNTIPIPRTDLRVSSICLGTGELGAGRLQGEAGFALLDAYIVQGGNFIDTAHVYADWLPGPRSSSEKALGAWFKARGNRSQVVLSTKGAHPDLAAMHIPRLARADIARDLEESLTYLHTDCIDLYWLHRDDPARPVADILESLNEQVRAGKIRYFGCSNWRPKRIQAALDYGQGLAGFVANQPMWSLAVPDMAQVPDKSFINMDAEGLAFHRRTGLTAIPYSSQAHGFFTKFAAAGRAGVAAPNLRYYCTEATFARAERAGELARRYGAAPGNVALAYLMHQPFPTIPIIGPKTPDQLSASLKAADLALSAADVAYLEGAPCAAPHATV